MGWFKCDEILRRAGPSRGGTPALVSKTDQVKEALARLRTVAGVEGSLLVSRDGLVVLADLAPNLDRESFSAMLAATLAAAETALIEIGRRAPERILVENQGTRLLVVGVSDQLLLAVLANGTTDLGLVQRALTEVGSRVRHAMA